MRSVGSAHIFPTKIWAFELENHDLDYYVKLLYLMKDQNMGKHGQKEAYYYSKGSWQSSGLLNISEFKPLFEDIDKTVSDHLLKDHDDRPKTSIKLKEAWGNINPTGTNILEHLHIGADYSGVLWLQTSPNCGNLAFRDPRIHYETVYQTADYEIQPGNGRVVIFPGWIRHVVAINHSSTDRVGIAFNFSI